jgi:hypothetical protein
MTHKFLLPFSDVLQKSLITWNSTAFSFMQCYIFTQSIPLIFFKRIPCINLPLVYKRHIYFCSFLKGITVQICYIAFEQSYLRNTQGFKSFENALYKLFINRTQTHAQRVLNSRRRDCSV